MLAGCIWGISMRMLCAFVLAALVWVLPLALGGDRAVAAFSCGMFDGKFQCKATSGGVAHGKNATPGVGDTPTPEKAPEGTGEQEATAPAGTTPQGTQGGAAQEVVQPGEHACPPGYQVLPAPNAHGGYCEPPGTPEAVNAACEHGMVGTPPNCHCPKNSEPLGGNCVHYTETCRIGLAADFTPQPCAGAEEKNASGRIEGLLLFDLRQVVGTGRPYTAALTVDLRSSLPQPTSGPMAAVSDALSTM